jgi:Domain of unknown function (DUF5710)
MRINLKTPFAEKDAVKALGARWDAAQKLWYITDVDDLTPFLRWIPDLQAARANAVASSPTNASRATGAAPVLASAPALVPARQSSGVITQSATAVRHCGCNALPWLDCPHTTGATP